MGSKLTKHIISLAALLSSTTLGLGMTTSAYAANHGAASTPPKHSTKTKINEITAPTVAMPTEPVKISMAQLDTHVAQLPQLAGLPDGSQIILSDDGSVTDQIWQGTYIYHPAGSKVPFGPMYARWKDGVVAITLTPTNLATNVSPRTLDASFVQQNYDSNHVVIGQQQMLKTLVSDGSDSSVLRIPDNAWLFRVDGQGQYTALVDVFTFQSGSTPIQDNLTVSGTLPAATGSQPVPISSGYTSAY